MPKAQMTELSADYREIDEYLIFNGIRKIFLVSGKSLEKLKLWDYFAALQSRLGIEIVFFRDFQPNPDYESIVEGVKIFCREQCDLVFAVGGGSAMDVAKCIKLYCNMNHNQNYLEQDIVPNEVKLAVIPTTAGTGSEATRYAVIYYHGEKQSVADDSIIPSAVFLDTTVLDTLPDYQKKAPLLDTLCHAIESYWSVNSTEESRQYSAQALELLFRYMDAYIGGDKGVNLYMLQAANLAGKAINITQTTAGHAMCYKLTSLYGIAHGHAAALCVAELWSYMLEHMNTCIDVRGEKYLSDIFCQISKAMGCESARKAVSKLKDLLISWNMNAPEMKREIELEQLITSVNPVRLKNHPVCLEREAIEDIYRKILE